MSPSVTRFADRLGTSTPTACLPGSELELVAGHARAGDHADHPRLDAEVGERLDQLAGDLLVILAGTSAGRAALEDRGLGQPVRLAARCGHRWRQDGRRLVERIVAGEVFGL